MTYPRSSVPMTLVAAIALSGCVGGQVIMVPATKISPTMLTDSKRSTAPRPVAAQTAATQTAATQTAAGRAGISRPVALRTVNRFRAERGRPPLRYSRALQAIAQRHANDMAANGFFSHRGSDGSRIRDRMRTGGYALCAAAENLAYGSDTTAQVMAQWRASPGHYRNMVNASYREFGLARAPGDRWVMVLATPRGSC